MLHALTYTSDLYVIKLKLLALLEMDWRKQDKQMPNNKQIILEAKKILRRLMLKSKR